MIRRAAIHRLVAFALLLVASRAGAEPVRTEIFLSSAAGTRAFSLVSSGERPLVERSGQLDYALFATELVAYLTKEILPDSSEEYSESPLGSRWNRSMPSTDSRFGEHCINIVTRIGSAIPRPSFRSLAESPPSAEEVALRGATAALALRQIWDAFTNDVEGNRSGVSLRPRVSTRRVGVNVTFHW